MSGSWSALQLRPQTRIGQETRLALGYRLLSATSDGCSLATARL